MLEFFLVFFLLSSIPPDRLGRCLVMHFYKKQMHAPAQHTHNAIEFQMMLLSNLDSIFIYYSFLNRWTRTRWTYAVEFSFFLNVCCIKWMRLYVVCMCVFFLSWGRHLGQKVFTVHYEFNTISDYSFVFTATTNRFDYGFDLYK